MLNCVTEEFVYKSLLGFVAFFCCCLDRESQFLFSFMLILMWH